LTRFLDEFFVPSRRARSGAYTNAMIYSPEVPVLRDDAGNLLPEPYVVDFITAAAPNVGSLRTPKGKKTCEEAEAILRVRIPRVLEAFARHGVRDLVLGAWGCGVFGNDPAIVARIFKEELSTTFRGRFRHVIFAVLDVEMANTFAYAFNTVVVPPSSTGSKWGAQRRWGRGEGFGKIPA